MLIDTHCHLADPGFDPDRADVVTRAREAGVGHLVVVGETLERSRQARELVDRFPGLSCTAGVHPHQARDWGPAAERAVVTALEDPAVVAVGETGLDYHYDHSPRDRQREAFEAQLALAARTGRPAVVHARDADDDVAAILANHPGAVAILHSYSSGPGLLRTAVARGDYIGWSGMITFRRWAADDLVRAVEPERLLVETDAPYLAPVPYRGQRNEPARVVQVAARLAEILGRPVDEIRSLTTENAIRVFGPRVRTFEEAA